MKGVFKRATFNRRMMFNRLFNWKIVGVAVTILVVCYIIEFKWNSEPEKAREEPILQKVVEPIVEAKDISSPKASAESKGKADTKVLQKNTAKKADNTPVADKVTIVETMVDSAASEIMKRQQKDRDAELSSMKEFMISVTGEARSDVIRDETSLEKLKDNELKFVKKGGRIGSMANYDPRHVVAVIIPVRSSDDAKLNILLRNLLPILNKKTDLHARIFVVSQSADSTSPYDEGAMSNIGYREAMKLYPFSCLVFQPVSVVPLSEDTPYGCERSPMQLVVNVRNTLDPFASVDMITQTDFESVNGYPNDQGEYGVHERFYRKTKTFGKVWHRPSREVGVFASLRSTLDLSAAARNVEQMRSGDNDGAGLQQLRYHVDYVRTKPLYTLIAARVAHPNGDPDNPIAFEL